VNDRESTLSPCASTSNDPFELAARRLVSHRNAASEVGQGAPKVFDSRIQALAIFSDADRLGKQTEIEVRESGQQVFGNSIAFRHE
jgi:hypothetical protein